MGPRIAKISLPTSLGLLVDLRSVLLAGGELGLVVVLLLLLLEPP